MLKELLPGGNIKLFATVEQVGECQEQTDLVGEEVLSVLKLCAYDEHEKFRKDMSADADMIAEVNTNKTKYGIPATIKYVGPRGDRGGGLDKETADWLSKSVDGSGQLGVTLNSSTGMLDQYLRRWHR